MRKEIKIRTSNARRNFWTNKIFLEQNEFGVKNKNFRTMCTPIPDIRSPDLGYGAFSKGGMINGVSALRSGLHLKITEREGAPQHAGGTSS